MIFTATARRFTVKIGNAVKFRKTGKVGLIVEKTRHCVPDGNPNGDFTIEYRYKIACGEDIVNIPQSGFWSAVEVVA